MSIPIGLAETRTVNANMLGSISLTDLNTFL